MKDCGSGHGQNESYWKHLLYHAWLCITLHYHALPSTWQHGTQERGDSGGLKWRRSDVAFLRITRRFSQNRPEGKLGKLIGKIFSAISLDFVGVALWQKKGLRILLLRGMRFLDAFPGACHDLFSSFVSLQYHHFGYFWVTYLRWLRPACCEQKRLS